MLELQPDILLGDVRTASAASTRSALEAIKKKFELSAAAAFEANGSIKLPTFGSVASVPTPTTADASEPAMAAVAKTGLIDSRGCAKPAKKVSAPHHTTPIYTHTQTPCTKGYHRAASL